MQHCAEETRGERPSELSYWIALARWQRLHCFNLDSLNSKLAYSANTSKDHGRRAGMKNAESFRTRKFSGPLPNERDTLAQVHLRPTNLSKAAVLKLACLHATANHARTAYHSTPDIGAAPSVFVGEAT